MALDSIRLPNLTGFFTAMAIVGSFSFGLFLSLVWRWCVCPCRSNSCCCKNGPCGDKRRYEVYGTGSSGEVAMTSIGDSTASTKTGGYTSGGSSSSQFPRECGCHGKYKPTVINRSKRAGHLKAASAGAITDEKVSNIVGPRGLRILCLDGGGVRGLIECDTLLAVMNACGGKPLDQLFDMIVGTSVGGLLALALGCIGTEQVPIERLKETYRDLAIRLFGGDNQSCCNQYVAPFFNGERYDSSALMTEFQHLLSTTSILDPEVRSYPNAGAGPSLWTESTSKPAVFVTAVNMQTPTKPFLIRNYDNKSSEYNGMVNLPFTLAEAARATSAAPIFFKPLTLRVAESSEEHSFLDGGLIANNPTELALVEAKQIFGAHRPVEAIVSIGAGNPLKTAIATGHTLRFEEIGVNIVTDAQNTDARLALKYPVPANKNSQTYFRFSPPDIICTLDESDPARLAEMEASTKRYLQSAEVQAQLRVLAQKLSRRKTTAAPSISGGSGGAGSLAAAFSPSAGTGIASKFKY